MSEKNKWALPSGAKEQIEPNRAKGRSSMSKNESARILESYAYFTIFSVW